MFIFGKTYSNDYGVEFLEIVKFSKWSKFRKGVLFLNFDNIDEETGIIDTIIQDFFFVMIKF